MSKKVILVTRASRSAGSDGIGSAEYWAKDLGQHVDSYFGEEFEKEVYPLKSRQYQLGKKGMKDIVDKYGTDIIVAFDWVSRLSNTFDDFDYLYRLVKRGVIFYFDYGSSAFVWNKKQGLDTFIVFLKQAETDSQARSSMVKDSMKEILMGRK